MAQIIIVEKAYISSKNVYRKAGQSAFWKVISAMNMLYHKLLELNWSDEYCKGEKDLKF